MIKNEKTKSVLYLPQKGFWGIIRRMRRERERRWVLRMIQERTLDTGIKIILSGGRHFHLKNDSQARYNGETGFINWVAKHSLSGWRDGKRWFDFKAWNYNRKLKNEPDKKKRDELEEKMLAKRMELYNSIIDECVNDLGYIWEIEDKERNDGLGYIHTSPRGDTFVSQFWYKCTIGHPIGTGLIIAIMSGVLIYYATERIKGLQPQVQENQIYQIQLIPYENR